MTSQYSIKDLERLSGIKAHTIRIWEKRYDILNPERTDTNIRFYCDDDLKRLLNISVLIKNGGKISKIASLSNELLNQKILELNNVSSPAESGQIENLIVAMIDMDEAKFEKVLNNSIIQIGFEETMFNVVYPLLKKIGILWQIGTITPVQEHFISNLVRQKLYAAIDALPVERNEKSKTFLLTLPQWELHDLGLLVYNYLIRKKGHKTVYLGQGVPIKDVISIHELVQPDAIITSFSTPMESEDMIEYLSGLTTSFKGLPIYVGGIQLDTLNKKLPPGVIKFPTVTAFRDNVLKQF
jgi:DNA-binding transcriptional MerR regulator